MTVHENANITVLYNRHALFVGMRLFSTFKDMFMVFKGTIFVRSDSDLKHINIISQVYDSHDNTNLCGVIADTGTLNIYAIFIVICAIYNVFNMPV